MELVENKIEDDSYSIFLPRNYYINIKCNHGGNTWTRYYLCTKEEDIENIHGILYFGTNQDEHKIRFNEETIIEKIESTVLNERIVWPLYYTEENYFTVITMDYKPGSVYHVIRIEGKEKIKEDLIHLIKDIFTTLKRNDNIN